MQVRNIEEMVGGWFIGNFDPAILKTEHFEVGYKLHRKGEDWPAHYHTGMEYNFLISGKMEICGEVLEAGALFTIESMEVAAPVFLEDCQVVVIKVPSLPGDKYIVDKESTDADQTGQS
jgi:hypothetical protein